MKRLILQRLSDDGDTTFGVFIYNNLPVCLSIENTWKFNQPFVSCVPAGLYVCNKLETTKARGLTFRLDMSEMNRLTGIKRTNCDIHPGNTHKNTEGCLLSVTYFTNIYGIEGGAWSVTAFKKLMKVFEGEGVIELEIRAINYT